MAKRMSAFLVLVAVMLAIVQPLLAYEAPVNIAGTAAHQLDSLTQGGGPTADVKRMETTQKGLADAAKQLDATTSSGGPTAAQNQKIQE